MLWAKYELYVVMQVFKNCFSVWFAWSNMNSSVQEKVPKRAGYFFQCLTTLYKPFKIGNFQSEETLRHARYENLTKKVTREHRYTLFFTKNLERHQLWFYAAMTPLNWHSIDFVTPSIDPSCPSFYVAWYPIVITPSENVHESSWQFMNINEILIQFFMNIHENSQ